MPAAVLEKEDAKVEWTPELDALAKEPAFPSLNAEPAKEPEAKEPAPHPSEKIVPSQAATFAKEDVPPDEESSGESVSVSEGESDSAPALDPDEIGLAKMYGFTDEEISEFTTSQDLARAIAPFERSIMAKQPAPQEQAEPPKAQPKVTPKAEPKEEAKAEEDDLEDMSGEEFDPDVARKFNKVVARLKAERAAVTRDRERLEFLFEQNNRAHLQQRIQHFDSLVDTIGDERFGPEDGRQRTRQQSEARAKLWDEAHVMLQRLAASGKQPELNSALLKRSMLYAFPDEIQKQERAKVQQTLVAQSKKRTGRPTAPKVNAVLKTDPEKDPQSMAELHRIFNEMASENGSR